jgi:hypothetical protein
LWELPSGRKIGSLDVGTSSLLFTTFSSDQNWLAVFYTNVHLAADINPAKRAPEIGVALFALATREKHLDIPNVETMPAINADGRLRAVGYKDGSIQVWDIQAKKELFHWRLPDGQPPTQLLFTPQGNLVLNTGQSLQQFDLRLLRQQLAEIGLDW